MSKVNQIINRAGSPVIVALDYPTSGEALQLVEKLDPTACRLKVGKQLFTAAGPELVKLLVGQGYDVFLDLKFHDIPNTVAGACKAAADLGVWMVNVHASGGRRMMEAARDAVDKSQGPLLIGVSVLTSMSDEDLRETGIRRDLGSHVEYLSAMAVDSGLDGMVCSAQESSRLKELFGEQCLLVTPGIRTENSEKGDQRRVMTPQAAIDSGSDYLVIGRSITGADNPLEILKHINNDLGVAV